MAHESRLREAVYLYVKRLGTVLAVLTFGAMAASTATLAEAHDFELADLERKFRSGPTPITVYLHRDGGRVLAGDDDPTQARSGVVRRSGFSVVDVPAFVGSDKKWDQFVGCVENHFRAFDVTVTDERPRGRYVSMMVGGAPSMLGMEPTVGGVAPYNGKVLPSSMVFVFQTPHPTIRGLCDTAAHELGHVMGLDHSRICNDLMSYEQCGSKAFRDDHGHCGEWGDRPCADGRSAQNSWQSLAARVGHHSSPPSAPAPMLAPTRKRPKIKPTLDVKVGPEKANSTYVVQVTAADPDGVADVELVWYDRRARKLTCGKKNAARPFSCIRRGSEYTFFVPVRTGKHKFFARLKDGRGQVTRTGAYQATFR